MSIIYQDNIAILNNHCDIGEAEELLEWLIKNPGAAVDFSCCEHIHATILYILIATKPNILAYPNDEGFKLWLENVPFKTKEEIQKSELKKKKGNRKKKVKPD
jgi:hypothetical protein